MESQIYYHIAVADMVKNYSSYWMHYYILIVNIFTMKYIMVSRNYFCSILIAFPSIVSSLYNPVYVPLFI